MSGFGSWTSWASKGLPSYVIPESGTVLVHVNATDLHNGTAKVGGAWTQNGTVPYTAATSTTPASVGPFSDSNYFSQTSASPANVSAPPLTIAIILNATSYANQPIPFCTGSGTTGFYIQPAMTSSPSAMAGIVGGVATTTANTLPTGSPGILIFGFNSSNTTYIQLNGGTTATSAGTLAQSLSNSYIGRYTSTTLALNGTITEIMVSTAVPSGAAFTAIYNGILANWPGA